MNIFRQILGKNIRVKMGMFALAVLLWFLVVTERTYEYVIDTPIQLVGLKINKTVAEPIPEYVKVKYNGRGRELIRLMYISKPHLRLDLTTITNKHTFKLKSDMVVLPGGINATVLEIIQPDTIGVVLDERLRLTVPVNVKLDIEPEAGYVVTQIKSIPNQVEVTGPKQIIDNLKQISTEYKKLEGIKRNTELELNLEIPQEYGLTIHPMKIRTVVNIERLVEKTFINLPIRSPNLQIGKHLIVEPPIATVTVIGGFTALSNLKPEDIIVYFDSSEVNFLNPHTVNLKVACELPVKAVKIVPPGVRIFKSVQ